MQQLKAYSGPVHWPYIVAFLIAAAVAVAEFTYAPLDTWYHDLAKPSWHPPEWVFAPIWTVIFMLTAWAGATAWMRAPSAGHRRWVLFLLGINVALNLSWSALLFTQHLPTYALYEMGILWLSVLSLIIGLRGYHKLIVPALLPYLLWVSYSASLNAAVAYMNGFFNPVHQ